MLNSRNRLTAGCFLAFFAFGFIDHLKGPILPELLRSEQLSLSQGGTIFLGAYVGFIIATLLTGFLADWGGNRLVLLIAGMLLCIGLLGVSLNVTYPVFVLLMGVVGLGLGAIEVGANGLIVVLHRENAGRYLNLLASSHGTGSFLVPVYVAWLLHLGVGWQRVFLSVVLLSGLLTVSLMFSPEPTKNRGTTTANWNLRETLKIGFSGQMGWYYCLICSYVALELGLAAWLMEYLQQIRGKSSLESSYYLSGFFMTIMLGRFIGSFFVEKLGYLRMVGVSLVGGVCCLIAGIYGHEALLIALPMSGGFFSIVFPTVTAVVTSLHQKNIGKVLGILFTFGGIGGALGPWMIGVVSDWIGLQMGMCMTIVYGIVAIAALLIVVWRTREERKLRLATLARLQR